MLLFKMATGITLINLLVCWSLLPRHGDRGLSEKIETPKPLNGQHLRIIWPRWKGNPPGLSGPVKGGVVVDYFSHRYNFTYEMVRVTENKWDPPVNSSYPRGLLNYLTEDQADLLVDSILPNAERLKIVDLSLPWISDIYLFLIPLSNVTANTNAVIKPFQWPVWLLLGVSIVFVIFVLSQLQRLPNRRITNQNLNQQQNKLSNPYLYVFGNLMSQGGPVRSKRFPFRLVAASWTLAAFILVQAYTSILFTYIMTPNIAPLINSIDDVAQRADVNFLLRKDSNLDLYLMSNKTGPLFRKLREKADLSPKFRCQYISECISMITPGSKNAFANARSYHLDTIKENYEKTGKCTLQLSTEGFFSLQTVFALQKNSRYTNSLSIGALELQEIGLIDYWDLWFRPMPSKCVETYKKGYKSSFSSKRKTSSLSLNNLAGAFIVLGIGLGLSMLVFLYQQIVWLVFNN